MSTEKNVSSWLEKALAWLQKQLDKWYGLPLCIVCLPLLFVFTLVSWPIRYLITYVKGMFETE